jgi:hypothetical protein
VALYPEPLGPDLVGPARRADRVTDALPQPGIGFARILAVAGQERLLSARMPDEFLDRQTPEVLGGRTQVCPSEVDDSKCALVDEPVAGLPVAVCRHGSDGDQRPGPDHGAERIGDVRIDPMRTVEPRQRFGVHARLIGDGGCDTATCQTGKQSSGEIGGAGSEVGTEVGFAG